MVGRTEVSEGLRGHGRMFSMVVLFCVSIYKQVCKLCILHEGRPLESGWS